MNGAKIVENIFFTVTCISVFTCVIRSDYNFAMGLLSYYMIKNIGNKVGPDIMKIARTVSLNKIITKTVVNFIFKIVDAFDCHDNRDGCPVDLGHERGLVRQASEER